MSPRRTQRGPKGVCREQKGEILTFPFGCLPVYQLVSCLLGVSLWRKDFRPDFPKDRQDSAWSFLLSFLSQLLLSAGVFLARCWVRGDAISPTNSHGQVRIGQAGDSSQELEPSWSGPMALGD